MADPAVTYSALAHWLSTLSPADLGDILVRRPDVYASPIPDDLAELADRLSAQTSVAECVSQLPLPAIQVIEALQALTASGRTGEAGSHEVPVAALAAMLGRAEDDHELDATLRVLAQRALVWPAPDGEALCSAPPLWHAFLQPLGLGRCAAELLSARSVNELRDMAERLGLPASRTKAETVARLAGLLSGPDAVRTIAAAAPPVTRQVLDAASHDGPVVESGYVLALPPELTWATERGLLVVDGYELAEMPREVALALRGPDWHAAFTPVPPGPALRPVESAAVAREAGSAAGQLIDQLAALIEAGAATPIQVRKSGGVGIREVRRLAAVADTDEPGVRLLLELARTAGLLGERDEGILPTEAYDTWSASEPAERAASVIRTWLSIPAVPLLDAGTETETRPAPFMADPLGRIAVDLRAALVRVVDELPPGLGVTDPATVAPLVTWTAPLPAAVLFEPEALVDALWREAVRVGVVAHGAVSPLGRALAAGHALDAAAKRLLPSATTTARFQADLSVVVAGSPTAALRELLDSCADREARGAASVWRFSPASVRRALDAGTPAADLLARLRLVATGGTLPQPLEYLIGDVDRRHGTVRVRAVGCVLRVEDPALFAELTAARALRSLGLALLAPTVLASQASTEDTLAALRAAGYAPVNEDSTGAVRVERPPRHRAEPAGPRRRRGSSGDGDQVRSERPRRGRQAAPERPSRRPQVDPLALATALLCGAAPAPSGPRRPPEPRRPESPAELPQPAPADDTATRIARRAPQLSRGEVRLLAHATDRGAPVQIQYVDSHGTRSTRVIEEIELHGSLIEAWCRLRQDDRAFSLDGIKSVSPA